MQYYGPPSSFYFNKIRSHLKHVLQRDNLEILILLSTASKVFATPAGSFQRDVINQNPNLGEDLTRTQEEYFLHLFWQLYHCTAPILDHGTFNEH
jgi:hypothetical protein